LARWWQPGRPVDLAATWGTLRRGAGDPTWRSAGGVLWRGVGTPWGPVTLRVAARPAHGGVQAHAWGERTASQWLLDQLPQMLGQDDDPTGFEPQHEVLAAAYRRHGPGWRVPRTGLVLESLVPAVIEQKVTGQEAFG